MAWKSYLKPENSIIAGLGVMGTVYALYQLNVGSVAAAGATDPNHPILESARKKAGYTSLIVVAGIGLIARDANIIILGAASIIGMELIYRHSIMSHPETGVMQPPSSSTYEPAGATISTLYEQSNYGNTA
jgi:hypothetical protein